VFWSQFTRIFRAISEIEKQIGYRFKNQILLTTALTHRSMADNSYAAYERLEFLGDAILELVTAEYLYKEYPKKSEGDLTQMRSIMVNGNSLYQIGTRLNLEQYCIMDKSLDLNHLSTLKKLLSSMIESLIGAIYLDGGLKAARRFIQKQVIEPCSTETELNQFNYKGKLFEICQKKGCPLPSFSVEEIEGPDHARTYTVSVQINGRKLGTGTEYTKRAAEQKAAKEAYLNFSEEN
jgi:ribonuclease-3